MKTKQEKLSKSGRFSPIDIEKWLTATIAQTLKVEPKQVDVEQPLYLFGIDSLHMQSILAGVEKTFSINISEDLILDQDSIKTCAKLIHENLSQDSVDFDSEQLKTPEAKLITQSEFYRFSDFSEYPPYKNLKKMQRELGDIFFDLQEGVSKDICIINGEEIINFTSYNYLGMSSHEQILKNATRAMHQYGTSVSASRLVSGEKLIHQQLEHQIATLIGTEDAIVFTTGHATNVNTISHLFGPDDLILHDELAHNSLVLGAKFSGATRRIFPHNDWRAVDDILKQTRSFYQRILVIIEGIYSMDGDIPNVNKFIEVKDKHHAWLMIDEAHSIGVLGATGGGIREHFNINPASIEIWMGTLSKAFASCGGYIAAKKELIEYLKYTCPGFVYSVGITPANAGAALASISLLKEEPERIKHLNQICTMAHQLALDYKFNIGLSQSTPIVPIIIGDSKKCISISRQLLEKKINIKPIIYPAVAENEARLRVFITAAHQVAQIEKAFEVIYKLLHQ